MSYDSSSSAMISSPSTSHFSSDSNSSFLAEDMGESHSLTSVSELFTGKGKEKAPFPVLPPLTFSNMDFDYQDIPPTPGPSSYGISPTIHDHGFSPSSPTDIPISLPAPIHSSDAGVHGSNATRCQSLTNLSHQAFPPSVGSPSSAVESAEHGAPSNLSCQLLDNNNDSGSLATGTTLDLHSELDNQLPPWYITADAKSYSRSHNLLKPKNRSHSSPYPISALDIIPDASTDIFQPLPIFIPNYFDLVLPKELRLHILHVLIDLHEDDHRRSIVERRITVAKATSSRGRWVGRDKGFRELFKLSRVCL
jgi:F-box/leucine-rich repeat protein 2/20